MKSEEYFNDLHQIRTMMERSTKFLSLAGWSGIVAGVLGLAAGVLVMQLSGRTGSNALLAADFSLPLAQQFLAVAAITLLTAVVAVLWFSLRKAHKLGQSVWNAAARRLLVNMAIPLTVGGILVFILIFHGATGLVPGAMLMFYGAAMLNAGNFTFGEIRYMGIAEMGLGLLAAAFTQWSLLFWVVGFGALHIVYGIYLHLRYEK